MRKNFCLRNAEFSSESLVAAAPATFLSGWKLEPCIFGLSPEFCAVFSHRNLSQAILGKEAVFWGVWSWEASWGRFYGFGLVSGAVLTAQREGNAAAMGRPEGVGTPWGWVGARPPPGPRTRELSAPVDALGLHGVFQGYRVNVEEEVLNNWKVGTLKNSQHFIFYIFKLNLYCLN